MNNARAEIINEYHQLIRRLNISNRTKNEKTELKFFIKVDPNNTLILYCSVNNEHGLQIGYLKVGQHWQISQSFEYLNLGEFIKKQLNSNVNIENINSTITNSLSIVFAL